MTREEIIKDECQFIALVANAVSEGRMKGPSYAAIAVGDDREGVSKT